MGRGTQQKARRAGRLGRLDWQVEREYGCGGGLVMLHPAFDLLVALGDIMFWAHVRIYSELVGLT